MNGNGFWSFAADMAGPVLSSFLNPSWVSRCQDIFMVSVFEWTGKNFLTDFFLCKKNEFDFLSLFFLLFQILIPTHGYLICFQIKSTISIWIKEMTKLSTLHHSSIEFGAVTIFAVKKINYKHFMHIIVSAMPKYKSFKEWSFYIDQKASSKLFYSWNLIWKKKK